MKLPRRELETETDAWLGRRIFTKWDKWSVGSSRGGLTTERKYNKNILLLICFSTWINMTPTIRASGRTKKRLNSQCLTFSSRSAVVAGESRHLQARAGTGIGNSSLFGRPLFWIISPSDSHSISLSSSTHRFSIAVPGVSSWSPIHYSGIYFLKAKPGDDGVTIPSSPVRGAHRGPPLPVHSHLKRCQI